MKKQVFLIFLLLFFVLSGVNCVRNYNPFSLKSEQKNNGTAPPDSFVTCPQTDIPWPSLANSPWPKALRTAQGMARTPLIGPRTGEILWQIPLIREVEAHPVIGPDGTIYVCTEQDTSYTGLLYAVSPEGQVKWTFRPPKYSGNFQGCIMVASDSTIYVGTYSGTFYALHPNGTVKWYCELGSPNVEYGNNIGLDGTIYTTTMDGYLHAINPDGTQKWKAWGISGFESDPSVSVGVISISPDGQSLYLQGKDYTLNAVSTKDGSVLWQKKMNFTEGGIGPPVVDSQGNIYCAGTDNTTGSYLFSFDPSGKERWRYKYSKGTTYTYMTSGIVLDSKGCVYFSAGSYLYSLDYAGNVRWIRGNGNWGASYRPLLCDGKDIIYYIPGDGILRGFNRDGTVIFQKQLDEWNTEIGAIGENGVLYTPTWTNSPSYILIAIR